MNKDFLFATSSRKIKNDVVESQITLIFWPCLNDLKKNMAQLIIRSFLMIQYLSFTSAAFEVFAEAYLSFLVSALAKIKNAGIIKFLGISKKYVSENEIFFGSRKKINFSLNNKVSFKLEIHFFKLDLVTQIIYCIIHRCLCFHSILFFSYISL